MFRGCLLTLLAASLISVSQAAEAPAEVYLNRISITNAQVNARHFVNEAEFRVSSSFPWDSMNTVTFTNRAFMTAGPGFRFETVTDPFGFRQPAQVFFNSPNGVIEAVDSGGSIILGAVGGLQVGFQAISSSILKVNAVNITNRGVMTVGTSGFLQLHGQNIDLSAGALIVGSFSSGGGFGGGFPSFNDTNFFPSPGIYDWGWGISLSTNASAQGVLGGVNPTSVSTMIPPPAITNAQGFCGIGSFQLDEALTWVREEVIDETNEVVQLVAVQVSDPSIGVFASFVPSTFPPEPPLGGFLTAAVEFRVGMTDFATLARVTNSVYVLDQFGASTNRALMLNQADSTFRPGNFIVHRGGPNQYMGQPASTNIRDDLFTVHLEGAGTNVLAADYVNTVVSNEWSIYPFEVASSANRLPVIPGIAITNLGGQVQIEANELKMANTRMRGEGFISLTASNVTTGPNVVVDVPRMTVNYNTKTEILNLNEFTPDRVERFSGFVQAYSALWTNNYERYVTNPPTDPADTNVVIVTNLVEVRFQLTLVDGRSLQTTEETIVQDLRLESTVGRGAVFFNENLRVTNYVQIRANELTFSEGSSLYGARGVQFSYTNLQNVAVFTNFGTIQVNELADLRRSLNQPYERFVNRGTLLAYGTDIWANYFENTGTIASTNFWFLTFGRDCFGIPSSFPVTQSTAGNINIRAGTIRIDSGSFLTGGDIRLTGDIVKLSNWQGFAGARLVLDASQTLTDGGATTTNDIVVFGGMEMAPTRPTGDLLGTRVASVADTFEFSDIIWSAEDRGASAGAFANNLALGLVSLQGSTSSVFQFMPARENSAIYIDVLELDGQQAASISALTNGIILGMNVYYADVVSTNPAITAQSINRIFGPNAPFNLIWVSGFAGPLSAVDVPLSANGPVSRMNRGLRESLLVDSDGDGIPNGRDAFPLSAAAGGERDVQLVGVSHSASGVSFNVAGPQTANYVIERTTSLSSPEWQPVAGVLTNDPATSLKSFTDKIDQGSKQGYYRVRIAP